MCGRVFKYFDFKDVMLSWVIKKTGIASGLF